MSQYDIDSLFQFLTTTPEKGLRNMLIDDSFSEPHFHILMKIVRGSTSEQFDTLFTKREFPRMRFSEKESLLKPKFWNECEACLKSRGLLTPAEAKKVEKIAA